MAVDLSGYNTVAMRIAEFRQKHPEGSLRPVNLDEPFKVLELGGRQFICYTAAAYRTPDDPMPGIGVAWEPFPGRTPYTKDSELMNAETSAWGRAIVAVLAADTVAGIATREEVENRRAEQEAAAKAPKSTARSTRQATEPQSSSPASSPEPATETDITAFVKMIETAKNSDQLNKAWTAIGAKGALQTEIEHEGTKVTLEKFLFQRNDHLKSGSGN